MTLWPTPFNARSLAKRRNRLSLTIKMFMKHNLSSIHNIGRIGENLSEPARGATFMTGSGCYTQSRNCRRGGVFVAKLIEFYIPKRFRKSAKWVPAEARGQVIEFQPQRKTA